MKPDPSTALGGENEPQAACSPTSDCASTGSLCHKLLSALCVRALSQALGIPQQARKVPVLAMTGNKQTSKYYVRWQSVTEECEVELGL